MRVNITLSDDGPPFWFLGEPHNLRVSLSINNPGPVEVDLTDLSVSERARLLLDIERGNLEADQPLADIQKVYLQLTAAAEREPTPEVRGYLEAEKRQKDAQRALKIQEDRKKKEEKFVQKCQLLSKQAVRALRTALKDETDIRLLRTLRDLESAKKRPRVSVMDFIQERIQRLQLEIVQNINAQQNKNAKPPRRPDETLVEDVIESEQEVVQFTPEDIRNFAMGEPLGGETTG